MTNQPFPRPASFGTAKRQPDWMAIVKERAKQGVPLYIYLVREIDSLHETIQSLADGAAEKACVELRDALRGGNTDRISAAIDEVKRIAAKVER